MSFKRGDSFSATNPSQGEGKLAYVGLNTPTPCPPRGAVPVNQERGLASVFQLSTPGSSSVRDATMAAMSLGFIPEARPKVNRAFIP
jgi:hypothetical protein